MARTIKTPDLLDEPSRLPVSVGRRGRADELETGLAEEPAGPGGEIGEHRGETEGADGTGQVRLTTNTSQDRLPAWSPDGTRLALVASDPEPGPARSGEDSTRKRPRPIVVDRFRFKDDGVGYIGEERDHLHVLTLAGRRVQADPYGNRNGYRLQAFSERSGVEQALAPWFSDFSFGFAGNDYYGVEERVYWVVCQKK